MRYPPISSKLFEKNRAKVLSKLPKDSVAIVHSNDQMPRNGDLFFPYRQNSDFFYLTGIEQEKSILLLIPGESDKKKQAILFILEPNPKLEIWEGKKVSFEEAQQISGITEIHYEEAFHIFFTKVSANLTKIYLNRNENPRLQTNVRSRDDRFTRILKRNFPSKDYLRLAPILWECRLQKEPEEIELIQKACAITRDSFYEVIKHIKPGMYEYEIEAIITNHFISKGAKGHAYEPIIAGGKNACYLHYVKNCDILQPNDVLFMDFGAEYANYASDCSRALPISGTFTKRQREVYEAVLRVLKYTRTLIVAETTISVYQKVTCECMQEELLSLGLLTKNDIAKQTYRNPAYFTYFMHGVSHFLGLDTHDVGEKDTILKPGMIVTCEPGIYIQNEGLGIRLENDILVTENGNIDLMGDIPIEVDEIEGLMGR